MRWFHKAIFFGNKQCIHQIGSLHDVLNNVLVTAGCIQQNGLQGSERTDDSDLEAQVDDSIRDFAMALGRKIGDIEHATQCHGPEVNISIPTVSVGIGDLMHFGDYSILAESIRAGLLTEKDALAYKPLGVGSDGDILFAVIPCENPETVERGWYWREAE